MALIPLKGASIYANPENGALIVTYGGFTYPWVDRGAVDIILAIREDIAKNEAKEQHGREQTSASRAVTAARAKRKAVGAN